MIVISREAGSSIVVGSSGETCLVTVLKLFADRHSVSVLVNRASASVPGQLDFQSVDLELGASLKISDSAEVSLVDVRDDKARIGINAAPDASVHRLEVYEAIYRENQKRGDGLGPDVGMTGSPVPRPSSPKPPSLDVRLDEPRSSDGGKE